MTVVLAGTELPLATSLEHEVIGVVDARCSR